MTSRCAIVTGAGSGIGRAIAVELADAGFTCVLVGRTAVTLEETAKTCRSESRIVAADVTDHDSHADIITAAVEGFGGLGVLVNNAGGGVLSRFFETTAEQWQNTIALNMDAGFFLSRAAIEVMRPAGWGRIVNISSVYAHVVHDGRRYPELFEETPETMASNPVRNSGYIAAKAGLEGVTRELAAVCAPWGITVNAVAPGMIDTDGNLPDSVRESLVRSTPVGRLGRPEDIAYVVSMLASERAGFLTGAVVTADGGWQLW